VPETIASAESGRSHGILFSLAARPTGVLGDDERWPNEPTEPGEPEQLGDLEDLGPDVPEVDVPTPPDPSANEVPSDLARDFWKLVATFNVALFALALGPMLIVFRGELVNGGAVFLLGAGFFAYGYQRYRTVRARHDDGDDRDADEADHADDGTRDQNG
jgi:hypothetical protein